MAGNDYEAGKVEGRILTSLEELKEGQAEHKVKLEELRDSVQKTELRMGQVVTFEKCAEIRKEYKSVWPSTVVGWVILIVSAVTVLISSIALGNFITDVQKLVDVDNSIGDNSDVK